MDLSADEATAFAALATWVVEDEANGVINQRDRQAGTQARTP
jgi:hypothetical protein